MSAPAPSVTDDAMSAAPVTHYTLSTLAPPVTDDTMSAPAPPVTSHTMSARAPPVTDDTMSAAPVTHYTLSAPAPPVTDHTMSAPAVSAWWYLHGVICYWCCWCWQGVICYWCWQFSNFSTSLRLCTFVFLSRWHQITVILTVCAYYGNIMTCDNEWKILGYRSGYI